MQQYGHPYLLWEGADGEVASFPDLDYASLLYIKYHRCENQSILPRYEPILQASKAPNKYLPRLWLLRVD